MARKVMVGGILIAASLIVLASITVAANGAPGPMMPAEAPITWGTQLIHGIVGSLIYSALGLIILMLGFWIFDKVTPFSLNDEIAGDNNVAAGVVVAGIMIGLGIIVAAAIF